MRTAAQAAAAKRNLVAARAKRRHAGSPPKFNHNLGVGGTSSASAIQLASASSREQARKKATAAVSKKAATKTMAERMKPAKSKTGRPPKLNHR